MNKSTPCPVQGHTDRTFQAPLIFAIFIGVLLQIPCVQAVEPAWNYSRAGTEIGGVAVSPDGDLIAVGAGRVLFFARNGTLLAEEPFGRDVRMTADGKYTARVSNERINKKKTSNPYLTFVFNFYVLAVKSFYF